MIEIFIVFVIYIVDYHYGSKWTKHDICGAVFFMMRFMITMDLGIVQVHFRTAKTSKTLTVNPLILHVQPWHDLPSSTLQIT